MDDDYAEYGYDDPMDPLEVTAAHEYNHVLQYAYDVLQDKWMFESTATWMEEKVFPDVDDYHQYVGPWAQLSTMPITRFDRQNGDKVYGSAVFNRWLDDEYDESIVRRAWSCRSTRLVRPRRLRQGDPGGPWPRLLLRAGELRGLDRRVEGRRRRVHEGAAFPTSSAPRRDAPDGRLDVTGKLDHTGYALFDVAKTSAPKLQLTGSLPAGTAGRSCSSAARGRRGLEDDERRPPDRRQATVTLDNPGRYQRITAVVVNGSYDKSGWNGRTGTGPATSSR